MKLSLKGQDNYASIELTPETIEEATALLRMVKTIKKETPTMSVSFGSDGKITGSISFRKIKVGLQENFISLKNRSKEKF